MSIYEYKTRIRYSEVGPDGLLTHIAMLDLLQNCSTFHSEDLGIGPTYFKEKHTAWVLNSWQVCIDKMPEFGEEVTIQTWSYKIKGMLGFRNFRILDHKGATLVYANSVWAYVDIDTLSLVKCPDDEAEKYGYHPQLEMNCAPRKISLPDNMEAKEPFEVKSYFIDTNHHMNNSKYILTAMDYLPEDFAIHEIRAEYKKPAYYQDMIYPKMSVIYSESDNADVVSNGRTDIAESADCDRVNLKAAATVVLSDAEGNIHATVQFL